jgi:hypothetical protein
MIFLVGARRSGTNWLQRTLACHPEVASLPSETALFSDGVATLAERFQHANPGSLMMGRTYIRRESFLDAIRDLVDVAFIETLEPRLPDARYCIERTPGHGSHLRLIHDVFPDARVIHIIRDGRGVARSLLSLDWGPNTMAEAAQEWRDAVVNGRAGGAAFGDRYREVFYEQLVADPRQELSQLLSWLDLETSEDAWNQMLLEAASEFNVDPGSPGVHTDKWRQELTTSDISEFTRVAGSELAALGYREATDERAADQTPFTPRLKHRIQGIVRPVQVAARPRAVARRAIRRAYRRQARQILRRKHDVVERFERMLADGRLEEVHSMLSSQVRVRIYDGAESFRARGEEAANRLLTAIDQHRTAGLRATAGELHGSEGTFTSVLIYELRDTSRWTRMFVIDVSYPKITDITMYRFALAERHVDTVATPVPSLRRPAG